MAKHRLELLVLLTAFAVAPATAGNRIGPVGGDHSGESACPYERARLAAAAPAQTFSGPTRVTLMERLPRNGTIGGVVRRSSLNP
jgi:hypothetical protein